MTLTIMQAVIKGAKVAILTVREVETPANTARTAQAMPKNGDPVLKLPMLNQKSPSKYTQLCDLDFLTDSYNT